MGQVTSLSEAFEYVNSRYIFNGANYPGFEHKTPDDQLNFAINHNIYHFLKSLSNLTRRENSQWDLRDSLYKNNAIKTLINIIKLAEVLGATQESFAAIEPIPFDAYDSQRTLGSLVEDFLRDFITQLEAADHSGKHDQSVLRGILEEYWAKILSGTALFPQDPSFTLSDAYALIPEYM